MRSVVLLSGGLDSSVNFLWALRESNVALALTFDYGQRAAKREAEAAERMAEKARVPHAVLKLPFFSNFTQSALTNLEREVPVGQDVGIDSDSKSIATAKAVWVPNRNGVFLNIGAAYAESLGADWVVPGFNLEEAATFPDNSEAYLEAATRSLYFSTSNHVKVKCFTTRMNKIEIAAKGSELGLNFDWVWPCYFGGKEPCGQCESCQRFERARP